MQPIFRLHFLFTTHTTSVKEFTEFDKLKTRVLEDGIIEIVFKGGCAIEVEDIWDLRKVNLKISDNKPYAVLVQAEEFISFSKEVRELLASRAFAGKTIAKALVYKNIGQHILANFYLHVNKPHIKTKTFACPKKAMTWLKEEIQNSYVCPR